MNFPLISFFLLLTVVLILITGYLLLRKGINGNFEKILGLVLVYLLADCLLIVSVEQFYPHESWRDLLAPFIFGYGPLLYFAIESLKQNRIAVWKVLLHAIPFILSLLVYLYVLLSLVKSDSDFIAEQIHRVESLSVISFTGYGLWSFFTGRKAIVYHHRIILIALLRILFIFITMLFVMVYFSTNMKNNEQATYWFRMLVYSCMLMAVLMIFNYVNKEIFKSKPTGEPIFIENENVTALSPPRYERSALSAEQLQLYEVKLEMAVREEKLYLDQSLTLSLLAHHLKIPKHHLTQVFSVQVKQNFYQYINGFRIIEACSLLDSASENMMYLELVAEKSGFNSKVSFNRQFKTIMGCTPSEYRNKSVK